jgi:mRNA-degrading endonuclease toxin of MazEF toxin-antitoxin module
MPIPNATKILEGNNQTVAPHKPKTYTKWHSLKSFIHNDKVRPDFNIGEVWFCSFGENIGYEIDDKNKIDSKALYLRPVLIIQATSKDTFVGLPLTTQTEKYKNKIYASIENINDIQNTILYGQVKSFDAKRLQFRLCKISEYKLDTIKEKFIKYILYKKITPKNKSKGSD